MGTSTSLFVPTDVMKISFLLIGVLTFIPYRLIDFEKEKKGRRDLLFLFLPLWLLVINGRSMTSQSRYNRYT